MSTAHDHGLTHVADTEFLDDVVEGLSRSPGERRIPSRYLYDEKGCELFEAICDTPEYYPTRTELAIMRRDARTMADVCGPNCRLIELGSGASIKTQMLLDELESPASYVPVDIAPEYLIPSVEKLKERYPDLDIAPICANFAEPFDLPESGDESRTVFYFPGSTIGNFTRAEAVRLMIRMRRMAGQDGGILMGMDLKKRTDLLEAAYNDAAGITAQFTGNLVARLQRDLDAEIDPDQFEHLARYNAEVGRIEIYLKSTSSQTIRIGDHCFDVDDGELINTEYSYKYSLEDVREMAADAGLAVTHAWLDELNWFGVFFFTNVT